jgi:hypothetical protein
LLCKSGNEIFTELCSEIAELIISGKVKPKNPLSKNEIAELLLLGCNEWNGYCTLAKKIADDKRWVVKRFYEECKIDGGRYCFQYGIARRFGLGVEKNLGEAFNIFENGCNELFNNESCGQMAIMKYNGEGVEKDEKDANKMFERICGENISYGCYEAGYGLYGYNNELSEKYLRESCINGIGEACYEYGLLKVMEGDASESRMAFYLGCMRGVDCTCPFYGYLIYDKDREKAIDIVKKSLKINERYCELQWHYCLSATISNNILGEGQKVEIYKEKGYKDAMESCKNLGGLGL